MRIKLTLLPPLVNLILLVCEPPSSDQDKVKGFLDGVNRAKRARDSILG